MVRLGFIVLPEFFSGVGTRRHGWLRTSGRLKIVITLNLAFAGKLNRIGENSSCKVAQKTIAA